MSAQEQLSCVQHGELDKSTRCELVENFVLRVTSAAGAQSLEQAMLQHRASLQRTWQGTFELQASACCHAEPTAVARVTRPGRAKKRHAHAALREEVVSGGGSVSCGRQQVGVRVQRPRPPHHDVQANGRVRPQICHLRSQRALLMTGCRVAGSKALAW